MKKKCMNVLIYILVIMSLSCKEKKIDEIVTLIQDSLLPNYTIVDYAYGNFVSKTEPSIAVFCDKIRSRDERPEIIKIFIYQLKNNSFEFLDELKTNCNYFSESIEEFYKQVGIMQIFPELGEPHHFGWVGDFNGNGITEFMFSQSALNAEGSTIEFWEYLDSKFSCTLKAQDDITFIIGTNRAAKTMHLERYSFSYSLEDYEKKDYLICWDPMTEKYHEIQINIQ